MIFMRAIFLSIVILFCIQPTHAQQSKSNVLGIPLHQYPIQKIRVAMHVMQREGEDPQNFTIEDTAFLRNQITMLNANRQWPQPLTPNPLEITTEDIRIRFELDTITFLKDNHWWDFGNEACGIDPARCNGTCRSKMDSLYRFYIDENKDFNDTLRNHTFHIFYVGNSTPKKCFDGEAESFNTSKWLVMRYQYAPYHFQVMNYEWNIFLLLNHEISHGFGMIHPFNMKACCYPDIVKVGSTNNVVDYFPSGGASIAPCQGLIMHSTIINGAGRTRGINKALIEDCRFDNTFMTQIPKAATYTYEKNWLVQLHTSILIEEDATLIVQAELYLPSHSGRIILKPGAKLIIDGGLISNRCGEDWDGIYYYKKDKLKKISLKHLHTEYNKNGISITLKNKAQIDHYLTRK